MLEGVHLIHDGGLDVCVTLEQLTISFVISVTIFAICTDIETNNIPGTDLHRIFLWDNLRAHHCAYVHNTVTGRHNPSNFTIVPRPPYHTKYGPIEYKICEVMENIRLRKDEDWNTQRLEQEIYQAANEIQSFDTTFIHCGFKWA
jgi:hypothetical protein